VTSNIKGCPSTKTGTTREPTTKIGKEHTTKNKRQENETRLVNIKNLSLFL